MTHICVCKLTVIGSDNGLSHERRQAIIWTNAGILLIWPLGTNFRSNINRNTTIFIEENACVNVVCEMNPILSRPQCVFVLCVLLKWALHIDMLSCLLYLEPNRVNKSSISPDPSETTEYNLSSAELCLPWKKNDARQLTHSHPDTLLNYIDYAQVDTFFMRTCADAFKRYGLRTFKVIY